MEAMQSAYRGFHQQFLIAEHEAILFYKALGFKRTDVNAGSCKIIVAIDRLMPHQN